MRDINHVDISCDIALRLMQPGRDGVMVRTSSGESPLVATVKLGQFGSTHNASIHAVV